ncbi:MAG: flagellar basal-body rod protein FlgG [Planctomycetes bacterium]|nr:flagellar basal-body rod protein FlgG [Planctomycetota bacterium]
MAIRALTTAATGMRAQQQLIDVLANNIANVNTPGYKRSRVTFEDLFYQQLREVGATATPNSRLPTGVQVGVGAQLVAVGKTFQQGSLVPTDIETDIAIDGKGFFQVETFDGRRGFTRDGSFRIDEQGRLVTSDGFPLAQNITINQPDALGISVGRSGIVEVTTAAAPEQPVQVGQIQLFRFVNEGGLRAVGENLYEETIASGPSAQGLPGAGGFGELRQGFLEESNVDVVRELVNLIEGQRAYEISANAIKTADDMLQVANNLRS